MKRFFWVIIGIVVCLVGMVAVSTVAAGGFTPKCPPCLPYDPNKYEKEILNKVNALNSLIMSIVTNGVSSKPRRYYLTKEEFFDGSQANTIACASGFHMANFFEILVPSGLVYDMTYGLTVGDTGTGPPAGNLGWVRTGAFDGEPPFPDTQYAGYANCKGWSTNSDDYYGTIVYLETGWYHTQPATDPVTYNVAPWWRAGREECGAKYRVWCIEDLK